jgi:hypothetical protein
MDDWFFDSYDERVRDNDRIIIEEHLIFKGHEGQVMYAMFDSLRGHWVYDRHRNNRLLDTAYNFEGVITFRKSDHGI